MVKKLKLKMIDLYRKLLLSSCYMLAYLLLFYGYYKFIVPIWSYSGFGWYPDAIKITESTIFLVAISFFLPIRFDKPSDVLLHLQFLFPILPMLVLYGAENQPRLFLYYVIISYIVMNIVTMVVHVKAFRMMTINVVFFQRLLLLFGFLLIISIILFGGLRYLNFNLAKVYEFRSDAASILPGIYGYLSPLVVKVLFPFALLLAVVNKRIIVALLAILGPIMMFGLTSHKGPVFYPFAVLLLYFILKRKNVLLMLTGGYIGIILISLLDFMRGGLWIGSLMLRRVMLVPANLNYMYYDFFSKNDFTCWARSKISLGLIEPKFDLDTPHLIGSVYFSNEATGANTGWIGSGYANAGFSGMFLYAVIIGLLFSVLNSFSKVIDKRIIVAIVTPPLLALIMSSDLPTALLTHGFLLSLLLFSCFRFHGDFPLMISKLRCK